MENTNINNTNTINKPISLVIEDAKSTIINTLNNLNMHPTLLEMIMRDIYNEVNDLAKTQYEREKAEYEQALIEQHNIQQNNSNEEEYVEKEFIEEQNNSNEEEPTVE